MPASQPRYAAMEPGVSLGADLAAYRTFGNFIPDSVARRRSDSLLFLGRSELGFLLGS